MNRLFTVTMVMMALGGPVWAQEDKSVSEENVSKTNRETKEEAKADDEPTPGTPSESQERELEESATDAAEADDSETPHAVAQSCLDQIESADGTEGVFLRDKLSVLEGFEFRSGISVSFDRLGGAVGCKDRSTSEAGDSLLEAATSTSERRNGDAGADEQEQPPAIAPADPGATEAKEEAEEPVGEP